MKPEINTILHIKNITLFGICIIASYMCINFNVTNNCDIFKNIHPILGVFFLIDLFFTKSNDIFIHHIISLCILLYGFILTVENNDKCILNYTLINTEMSTIFLILKCYINKNSKWYHINNGIFYLLFFKFRLIDYYNNVIRYDSTLYLIINKYTPNNYLGTGILLVSSYGLYILNLYWFLIMNKILFKQLTTVYQINTYQICHYICSYTLFLNIPVCIYIYSYNKNEKNLLDIIGVSTLSICSYLFHNDIYYKLYTNQIETDEEPSNYMLLINDNLSIHLRSFLTVATNYYYHNFWYIFIVSSFIAHITSIYRILENIIQCATDLHYNKKNLYKINNILTQLPITVGIVYIFINSKPQYSIPFLLVNIIIGLLFYVKPFYNLNHVVFHILLLVQNYYLCLCHTTNY